MQESRVSFLTWLAIANTTISSRNFISISNTNAMLLPRQMFSTFHFDKLKFTKITNIVSYQTLLFSRCYTDQLSFFKLRSYAPLSIESSVFYEGKFEAIGKNVNVRKSKFHMKSNNFFKVENTGLAKYEFTDFTSASTSKPTLMFKNVKEIDLKICNFTNVVAGALKTASTKTTNIYFGIFNNCQSDIGGAIYSDSDKFDMEHSYFIDCSAIQSGGSLYLTKNNLNTQIIESYFIGNKSPAGSSIVNEGQLELLNCVFTGESQKEIVGNYKQFDVKFSFHRKQIRLDSTPTDTATPSYLPAMTPPTNAIPPKVEEIDTFTIMLVVLIGVLCVSIVVGIGFFVYWRMKKQRNTIYASEKEIKDENEMGTVEIKSKYSLTKVYADV